MEATEPVAGRMSKPERRPQKYNEGPAPRGVYLTALAFATLLNPKPQPALVALPVCSRALSVATCDGAS